MAKVSGKSLSFGFSVEREISNLQSFIVAVDFSDITATAGSYRPPLTLFRIPRHPWFLARHKKWPSAISDTITKPTPPPLSPHRWTPQFCYSRTGGYGQRERQHAYWWTVELLILLKAEDSCKLPVPASVARSDNHDSQYLCNMLHIPDRW